MFHLQIAIWGSHSFAEKLMQRYCANTWVDDIPDQYLSLFKEMLPQIQCKNPSVGCSGSISPKVMHFLQNAENNIDLIDKTIAGVCEELYEHSGYSNPVIGLPFRSQESDRIAVYPYLDESSKDYLVEYVCSTQGFEPETILPLILAQLQSFSKNEIFKFQIRGYYKEFDQCYLYKETPAPENLGPNLDWHIDDTVSMSWLGNRTTGRMKENGTFASHEQLYLEKSEGELSLELIMSMETGVRLDWIENETDSYWRSLVGGMIKQCNSYMFEFNKEITKPADLVEVPFDWILTQATD